MAKVDSFNQGIKNAKTANVQHATKKVQAKPLQLNKIFMELGVDTRSGN